MTLDPQQQSLLYDLRMGNITQEAYDDAVQAVKA